MRNLNNNISVELFNKHKEFIINSFVNFIILKYKKKMLVFDSYDISIENYMTSEEVKQDMDKSELDARRLDKDNYFRLVEKYIKARNNYFYGYHTNDSSYFERDNFYEMEKMLDKLYRENFDMKSFNTRMVDVVYKRFTIIMDYSLLNVDGSIRTTSRVALFDLYQKEGDDFFSKYRTNYNQYFDVIMDPLSKLELETV